MYGDEEANVSPDELYDSKDAEEALNYADYTYKLVLKLYREISSVDDH